MSALPGILANSPQDIPALLRFAARHERNVNTSLLLQRAAKRIEDLDAERATWMNAAIRATDCLVEIRSQAQDRIIFWARFATLAEQDKYGLAEDLALMGRRDTKFQLEKEGA